MKIEDLDKNFRPAVVCGRPVAYRSATGAPFSLEGFPWGDRAKDQFFRLPADMKPDVDVNAGALQNAHEFTAGGAIRFRSDANHVFIRARLRSSCDMNHMPRAGSSGFDLYVGPAGAAHHVGTAQPNAGEVDFERCLFGDPAWPAEMRDWTINFPLYGGAASVEIGLPPEARVDAPAPHATKPVLFYGSSITQGGCASRPGNNYCAMLCRAVDAEQINLGFSGCGKGEAAVAQAIATLDLGAFVMDYDHNAPDAAHLQATHEPFFRIVREARPGLPVVILSKCNVWHDRGYREDCARRDIIRATFKSAVDAGDRHVYFVDGETLFGVRDRDACTVDGCHPNDLGFHRMYEATLPVLRKALAEA